MQPVGSSTYEPPEVVDHGTLIDLTQSFELEYGLKLAKFVTLAAVSAPLGGVPVVPTDAPQPVDVTAPPPGDVTATPSPGDVAPGDDSPGGTLGDTRDSPETTQGGQGPTREVASGDSPAQAVAGDTAAGDDGSRLPFTGSWPLITAAFGAMLASTGVAIRTRLRRRA